MQTGKINSIERMDEVSGNTFYKVKYPLGKKTYSIYKVPNDNTDCFEKETETLLNKTEKYVGAEGVENLVKSMYCGAAAGMAAGAMFGKKFSKSLIGGAAGVFVSCFAYLSPLLFTNIFYDRKMSKIGAVKTDGFGLRPLTREETKEMIMDKNIQRKKTAKALSYRKR